jgi:hypothetical protein
MPPLWPDSGVHEFMDEDRADLDGLSQYWADKNLIGPIR